MTQTAAGAVGVILIGGDPLLREGLKSLFRRSHLTVLGEVDSLSEVDSLDPEDALPPGAGIPQVVLALTPESSDAGSPAWLAPIRAQWPDAYTVVVASRSDDGMLVEALRAGADGCLYTDMSPEALVQAIRLVALGENVFPTRIGRQFSRSSGRSERPRLTPRERDILRGLLAGCSNKMIANDLGTTDMTVKAQLRHLLRKLGVANRTQAALWAREQGLDKEFGI